MKQIIRMAVCLAVAVAQSAGGQSGSPASTTPPMPSFGAPGVTARRAVVGDQKEKAAQAQKRQARAKRVQTVPRQPAVQPAVVTKTGPKGVKAANANRGNPKLNSGPARTSYADALQRCVRERHDRNWWNQRYTTIVLVGGGYYYWDTGYWFPAWGYDPTNEYYDYNGPIYTYGNLLPDQVIVNVQRALQQIGYYAGRITGSLGSATRQAIEAYQYDAGLEVTGTIDAATVEALGLN